MPQQINLCTPILLTQKRYFSAQTMVQALAIFAVFGGGLCAYWVWSLNTASRALTQTLATQSRELESLKTAIAQAKAGVGSVEVALNQDLKTRRAELAQRELLLGELQRGLFRPGWGHAARLQLLARSIPAPVWLTEVKADEFQLDVSGYTLEPAALNEWVARLATSPLLQGQSLSSVKVEDASAMLPKPPASGAVRPAWSFHLVSALGKPAPVGGAKP